MGGKKVKGRKRHIVTDTDGHLLHVKVHETNTHDTVAGCSVFEEALEKYPSLKGVCADAGYRKTMEEFVRNVLKKTIEISERITPGWAILAKRWVVERTFAWLNNCRRLSKDYELAVVTVILPFIVSSISRGYVGCINSHAAIASFCTGVIPPIAMFGLSLL